MKNVLLKKRRGLLLWIGLLLISATSLAQSSGQTSDECFTDDDPFMGTPGAYSRSVDPHYLEDFDPVVFNIFFWGINDGDGNPGFLELTEEHCLRSVADLNRVYNNFNIFFKYYGMDHINSETYYSISGSEISQVFGWAEDEGYKKQNSFNIYVASGGAPGGAAQYYKPRLVVHHEFFVNEGLMVHEIGHNFGLRHTHYQWWAGHIIPQYCGDCENEEFCTEAVTRDPADPNYNADLAGDFVPDTAAVPDFRFEWCRYNGYNNDTCRQLPDPHYYEYVNQETYEYIGPGTDCLDFPYFIVPQDILNYIAYAPAAPPFSRNYTPGQGIRMREAIVDDPDGELSAAQTTIRELYEPYRGTYITYTAQPNNDPPLFQPGFEYYLWECQCPEDDPCNSPTAWEDTNFTYSNTQILHIQKDETDYGTITHPNHTAIAIKHPHDDFWPQPRKCFDNWLTPPIIGGSITEFHDGVFNTNVTITPKDSLGINDAHLIDNLDPGLYTIKKNKADGSVEDTNVLKEND